MSPSLPSGLRARPSSQFLGVLLVAVSACGFGSGALLLPGIYDTGMEPVAVLFWRFATAALFSWGWLLVVGDGRRALLRLSRRRMLVLASLGLLYVGNSFTYVASLQVVPITLSSIITYTYPAIVAVMATRFVRRLEGRRAWLALGISLAGVALALGGVPEGSLPPLWGLALAFASPLIYAGWIIAQARVAGDRPRGSEAVAMPPGDAEAAADIPDPAPAAAIMTSGTALVYAVVVVATGGSLWPGAVPSAAWPGLLGFGLVATAIAIQAFYAGVARIGGARAALISTVEPIYTITLATIIFGEVLAPIQVLGGALVIAGVLLAETGGRREPAESPTVGSDAVTEQG